MAQRKSADLHARLLYERGVSEALGQELRDARADWDRAVVAAAAMDPKNLKALQNLKPSPPLPLSPSRQSERQPAGSAAEVAGGTVREAAGNVREAAGKLQLTSPERLGGGSRRPRPASELAVLPQILEDAPPHILEDTPPQILEGGPLLSALLRTVSDGATSAGGRGEAFGLPPSGRRRHSLDVGDPGAGDSWSQVRPASGRWRLTKFDAVAWLRLDAYITEIIQPGKWVLLVITAVHQKPQGMRLLLKHAHAFIPSPASCTSPCRKHLYTGSMPLAWCARALQA